MGVLEDVAGNVLASALRVDLTPEPPGPIGEMFTILSALVFDENDELGSGGRGALVLEPC